MIFLKKKNSSEKKDFQNKQFFDNEWTDVQYEANPVKNKLELKQQERLIKPEEFQDDGTIKIDSNQLKQYQNTRDELIQQNNKKKLIYPKNDNQINYDDETNNKLLEKTSSIISQSQDQILPDQLIMQDQQKIVYDGKLFSLKIKGFGFSTFKVRKIGFRIKCSMCKQLIDSDIIEIQGGNKIFNIDGQCQKCDKKFPLKFQKFLIQDQQTNFWQIGQVKIQKDIDIQLKCLIVVPVCNCLSTSSRLPKNLLQFDTKYMNTEKGVLFKITKEEQARMFCHGCCKELFFQPEFLLISQK